MASAEVKANCAACGEPIDEPTDLPEAERQPCPNCGSRARAFNANISTSVTLTASVETEAERGLNDVRLAVLGILVAIGLTVGFGVAGPIWLRSVAGVGASPRSLPVAGSDA